jgi:hypothetical protein
MSTYVIGDTHGEFGALNAWINRTKPDLVLSCGDFGYWPRWGEPQRNKNWPKAKLEPKLQDGKLLFCDGNHEDHEELMLAVARGELEVLPKTFYQPRGSTYTLPDGRVVLFVGGALSPDASMRTQGRDWFQQEIITYSDMWALPDVDVDIVISHTAPREFDLDSLLSLKLKDPCRDALSIVLDKYKPSKWYFGHFHFFKQGVHEDCEWTVLDHIRGGMQWRVEI